MPETEAHPSPEALEACALGKCDDPGAAPIEEHLADCELCRDRVASVPPDTLIEAIASARTLTDHGQAEAPTPTPDGVTPASPFAATYAWGDTVSEAHGD